MRMVMASDKTRIDDTCVTKDSRQSIWNFMSKMQALPGVFSRQLAVQPAALFLLPCRADETQKDRSSCPRLYLVFQFGLCHVFVAISFLRSISLA